MTTKTSAPLVVRTVTVAEMVERLAFAACGAKLWPSPYAADYHRAAVRRMIDALTDADLRLIKAMKS
jgi:hypothetical protein